MIESAAKTGLLLELGERLFCCDQIDRFNISALPDEARKTLGFANGEVKFQIDRKVERVVPTATDRLCIFYYDIYCGRKRQRDTDNQDDHETRERLS